MKWAVADLHIGHARIINYCKRPFGSPEEMRDKLLAWHNELVKPDDTVYVLGDFALGQPLLIRWVLERMHGQKILIRGNHDLRRSKNEWKRLGFVECYDQMRLVIKDKYCLLNHWPIPVKEIPEGIDAVICGHIHNTRPAPPRNVCVSVEVTDYRPLSEDALYHRILRMPMKYEDIDWAAAIPVDDRRTINWRNNGRKPNQSPATPTASAGTADGGGHPPCP